MPPPRTLCSRRSLLRNSTVPPTGTTPQTGAGLQPAPLATVQEVQQPSTASVAAVGITPGEAQTIDSMIAEPHLTGSQLAAGPVQAVVAPAPVQPNQAAQTNNATPGAPSQPASGGPLSAFLEALP